MTDGDEWISVPQLAWRLGQPERTVRRWICEIAPKYPDAVRTSRGILRRTRYAVNYPALAHELRPLAAN